MPNKIVRWLHISDLHLLLDNDDKNLADNDKAMYILTNYYQEFFTNYRDKVRINTDDPLFDFVVITGDLHDSSGQSENNKDYHQTIHFLNAFICNFLKVNKKNVFIVPGNHDAIYPPKLNDRGQIVYKIDNNGNQIPEIDATKPANFENYKRFIEKFYCEGCTNRGTATCKGKECKINKYKEWSDNDFKGIHNVTWSNEIDNGTGTSLTILHLNTVAKYAKNRPIKNSEAGDANIELLDNNLPLTLPKDTPIIAIGHNPYPHLNEGSRAWIDSICKTISAHLCGDVHRRDIFEIGQTGVYSICGAKFSSDKRDTTWSDFGFIVYEWDQSINSYRNDNGEKDGEIVPTEGKVTVYPYSWNVKINGNIVEPARCGIQPAHDFRERNKNTEFYFWLKPNGTPQGLEEKCSKYINENNYSSDRSHKTYFSNIIKVLEEDNNKPKVIVIGDVMLDFVEKCDPTGVGQSKSHDIEKSFDMFIENDESTELGGAANVATMFTEVSKDVILFGVAGEESTKNGPKSTNKEEQIKGENSDIRANNLRNKYIDFVNKRLIRRKKEIHWDIFGKKLVDLADQTFKPENNHLFAIKEYLTVTKIYIKENDHIGTHVRINRELKGSSGSSAIMSSDNDESRTTFLAEFKSCLEKVDVVILKDHEKGLLNTPEGEPNDFAKQIIEAVNDEYERRMSRNEKLIIILDPKHKWECYKKLDHIDAIILNVEEMAAMLYPDNKKIWSNREAVCKIYISDRKKIFSSDNWWNKGNVDFIAITEGKNGVSYYRPNRIYNKNEPNYEPNFELSIPGIHITDYQSEIGAGCIFVAYFTTCLFNKNKIMDICRREDPKFDDSKFYEYTLKLANYAAARSCAKEVSRKYKISELKSKLLPDI